MKALALLCEKVAPKLDAKPTDLQAAGGRIVATNGKSLSWKQACALLGQQPVVGMGDRKDGDTKDDQGKVVGTMSSQGVGGAQFADVSVDVETGEVRVNKIVAVADVYDAVLGI